MPLPKIRTLAKSLLPETIEHGVLQSMYRQVPRDIHFAAHVEQGISSVPYLPT